MTVGKKYGPPTINPGTGRLTQHKNKGSRQSMLPHKDAMDQVTKGDPWQRSIGNYAKLTPSGAGAPSEYQDIINMGTLGAKVR